MGAALRGEQPIYAPQTVRHQNAAAPFADEESRRFPLANLCGRAWLTLSAAEPGFCRLMLRSKGKGVVCSSAGAVENFRYEEPPSVGNIRHPAPSVPLCCRLFSAVKRS